MFAGVFDLRGTSFVRAVVGSRHGGGAALQLRRRAGRVPRPRRRVFGLHAVRRHTVLVRGQFGDGPAYVLVHLQSHSRRVLRGVLLYAGVAEIPVQQRPLRGRQNGFNVRTRRLKSPVRERVVSIFLIQEKRITE